MDQLRIKNRTNWAAALFSCLFPGLGHLYLRFFQRGIILIGSYSVFLSLVYRVVQQLAEVDPMLVILLIVMFPWFYFISVFDVLQSATGAYVPTPKIFTIVVSVICMIASALFYVPMIWMNSNMLILSQKMAAVLMWGIGLYFLISSRKWIVFHYRLGRATVIIIIMLLGIFIWLGTYSQLQFKHWWIVIAALFLCELIHLFVRKLWTNRKRKIVLDFLGMLAAALVISIVYFVGQYGDYPNKWLESFHRTSQNHLNMDSIGGYPFTRATTKIQLPQEVTSLKVSHQNGQVTIQEAEIEEIEVYSRLWVNTMDEETADKVNEQSTIQVKLSDTIEIYSELAVYETNRLPRMDMEIMIPSKWLNANTLSVDIENGFVIIQEVFFDSINVQTNRASIALQEVRGDVDVQVKEGNVLSHAVNGDLDINVKKGDITIYNPLHEVKVVTLNGNIKAEANAIYGDWKLESTVGNVSMTIPSFGPYQLTGQVSIGAISSPYRTTEQRKKVEYRGFYAPYFIELYASNNIEIH